MRYGWIIDQDHIPTAGAVAPSNANATGMTGPRDIPKEIEERLKAGEGRAFRMEDGDGELYYSGRILVLNKDGKDEPGTETDFAPLDDFGEPNAGCASILYQSPAGEWEEL